MNRKLIANGLDSLLNLTRLGLLESSVKLGSVVKTGKQIKAKDYDEFRQLRRDEVADAKIGHHCQITSLGERFCNVCLTPIAPY